MPGHGWYSYEQNRHTNAWSLRHRLQDKLREKLPVTYPPASDSARFCINVGDVEPNSKNLPGRRFLSMRDLRAGNKSGRYCTSSRITVLFSSLVKNISGSVGLTCLMVVLNRGIKIYRYQMQLISLIPWFYLPVGGHIILPQEPSADLFEASGKDFL